MPTRRLRCATHAWLAAEVKNEHNIWGASPRSMHSLSDYRPRDPVPPVGVAHASLALPPQPGPTDDAYGPPTLLLCCAHVSLPVNAMNDICSALRAYYVLNNNPLELDPSTASGVDNGLPTQDLLNSAPMEMGPSNALFSDEPLPTQSLQPPPGLLRSPRRPFDLGPSTSTWSITLKSNFVLFWLCHLSSEPNVEAVEARTRIYELQIFEKQMRRLKASMRALSQAPKPPRSPRHLAEHCAAHQCRRSRSCAHCTPRSNSGARRRSSRTATTVFLLTSSPATHLSFDRAPLPPSAGGVCPSVLPYPSQPPPLQRSPPTPRTTSHSTSQASTSPFATATSAASFLSTLALSARASAGLSIQRRRCISAARTVAAHLAPSPTLATHSSSVFAHCATQRALPAHAHQPDVMSAPASFFPPPPGARAPMCALSPSRGFANAGARADAAAKWLAPAAFPMPPPR
ncbi:hypothetical protein C8R46DRAFT_1268634 [Mycena filopes]|nr:hypothetical protein C8R46DRAFT_1268634 [Mycena filopes]